MQKQKPLEHSQLGSFLMLPSEPDPSNVDQSPGNGCPEPAASVKTKSQDGLKRGKNRKNGISKVQTGYLNTKVLFLPRDAHVLGLV